MKEYDIEHGVEFQEFTGSNLPYRSLFRTYEEIEAALEVIAIIFQKELGFINKLKVGKTTELGADTVVLGRDAIFYGFEKEYKFCQDFIVWFKKKYNIQDGNYPKMSFLNTLTGETELELNFMIGRVHFIAIPLGSVEPTFNNLLILEKLRPVLCFSNENEGYYSFQHTRNEYSLKETTDIIKNSFVENPSFGAMFCKKGTKTRLIAELMEELEKEIETNV